MGSSLSKGLRKAQYRANPETANPLLEYAEDIQAFCQEVLGIRLYRRQLEIVEAVLKHRRVFVKSGHSLGKTAVAAVISEWVFSCLGDSVLTAAPSREQVRTLLWRQIDINRARAAEIGLKRLPGEFLRGTPEIRVEGRPDWWATGFYTNDPNRAAGRKHPRMFVVLDEMAGLQPWFVNSIDSSMASVGTRMLGIGNPIHAYGPFYDKFSSEAGHNHLITISVTDSPNVTVEQAWQIYYKILEICPKTAEEIRPQIESKVDEEPIPGLCDYQWIIEKIDEWRDDINEIRTRLLGLFPSDEASKVIPLGYIESAQALWYELEEEEEHYEDPPRIHCAYLDCAADGNDYSVLSYLRGQRIHIEWVTNEPDTMQTALRTFEWLASLPDDDKPAWLALDKCNPGVGIYNRLEELRREHPAVFGRCRLIAHHPGASADDKKNFTLSYGENYWRLREAIRIDRPRDQRLALPPDERIPFVERRIRDLMSKKGDTRRKPVNLVAELNVRTYTKDLRERTVIEGKPSLEKRGVKSTDLADSVSGLMIRPKIVTIVG